MATGSAVPVPASHLDAARDAEPATRAANAAMAATLPFADKGDFEDAQRGLIAPVPDGVVRTARAGAVEPRRLRLPRRRARAGHGQPEPVAQARLNMANGLFQVTERIYQVRGFDISNMTIIEGDRGLIMIDPLITAEVARAALELYRAHRAQQAGDGRDLHPQPYRPLRRRARRGRRGRRQGGPVAVIAPDGFMEEVIGENVLAGTPMIRRAQFQFGAMLPQRSARPGRCRSGQGHLRAAPPR